METFFQDVRYALRQCARNRGMTALAVATLALGIGANSAIFGVVSAVLLRPLPVRDPDRIVAIAMNSRKLEATGAQPAFSLYAKWREHAAAFESVAAAAAGSALAEAGAVSGTVKLWRISDNLFPLAGVSPVLGRNFETAEDRPGGAKVAILADSFWRSRFERDPRILGTSIQLDGKPHTIVGVLPPGFHLNGRPADIYTPFGLSLNTRDYVAVDVYARLRPGVTAEQANAVLDAMEPGESGPSGWKAHAWLLRDFQSREVRLSLWVLLGAVALVVLIACANIASLLLARVTARRREFDIRAAIGATRQRLLRQMLTESTVLAIGGGLAGVCVAALCIRLVPLIAHERLPGLIEQTRIDWRVLLFALALSGLTGLLFGAAPALATIRVPRRRSFEVLVVTETALALMLGIGATLLVRTFFFLRDVAPGFRVDSLVVASVNSERSRFAGPDQCIAYYEDLIHAVRAVPGVQAATFAQAMPLTGDNWAMSDQIEGQHFAKPQDFPVLWHRNVDRDYFRTLQIPLHRGRLFDERDDRSGPRVVMVNEAFVRRFWPGQDPIGKHIGRASVVGVVGDVRHQDTTRDAPVEVLFPYRQAPTARVTIALRVDPAVYKEPLRVEPALRAAVGRIDGAQPVTRIAEMRQLISDRVAPKRLSAQLIAAFAGLAILLAALGIYGVLSYAVSQRTHEIGIRMALGEEQGALMRGVMCRALLLAAAGVAAGLAGALGLSRLFSGLLFGVSPTEGWVYAAASAAILALAGCAALLPAWRASRVDPLLALRHE